MPRLIDADALMKRMCEQCNIEMADAPCEPKDCFVRTVIMDCHTIDAVPVVRCKDCKYYSAEEYRCDHPNLEWEVECYDHWIDTEPNDFCSYGERRSDD